MPTFATNPTSTYVGFDWNCFEWGFSVMDIVPTFDHVIMERGFQRVEAGQAVAVVTNIKDIMTTLGERFDFNPDTAPTITLYNPDDTVKVAPATMNFYGLTGHYIYQHQTTPTDQAGVYSAVFKAINGTMTGVSDKVAVFRVTAPL